jgi:5-methylcytosine-specific restriction protein A
VLGCSLEEAFAIYSGRQVSGLKPESASDHPEKFGPIYTEPLATQDVRPVVPPTVPPVALMDTPAIDYAELDPPVVELVRVLNDLPGIFTVTSCGGHENPGRFGGTADQWWVTFQLDQAADLAPTRDAWLSLEWIGWVYHDMRAAGRRLMLTCGALPPMLNGPGRTLRYSLEGNRDTERGLEPDELADAVVHTYEPLWFPTPRGDGGVGNMTPTRLCPEPRCPNPATARGRCDDHRKEQERHRSRARRADTRERNRMYTRKKWAMTRRAKLFANPLCELEHPGCLGIASEVHHRIAMEVGGARYDLSNLVSTCKPCHSRETRREQTTRAQA